MTPRRRLTPTARHEELLDVATELFASHGYDDVTMEAVAARAAVSRALLYRYFPSKRDLFAGVYQAAADRLLEITTLVPDLPLEPQIVAGLDAHIDYFVANRSAVLTANRTLAGDPIIQAIISDELAVLRERVLATQPLDGPARQAMSAVLMSWLTFVRVLCVDWLAAPAFSRTVLRDVCVGALLGSLAAL
ncbi:MAG: TetR/AcrR family transcriptional regulator [Lapillicoccus sp.]